MSEGIIRYKNATKCVLDTGDYGLAMTMGDTYSFYAPGYQFTPKFKQKRWDGRIRLFSLVDCSFPTGLLPRIVSDFPNLELDEYVKSVFREPNSSREQLNAFYEKMRFYSNCKEITPREDQKEALYRAIQMKRCTNVCPTSFGKSLCIFMECLWHIAHNRRCVIIVPTIDLVEQFYNDITDYCTMEDGSLSPLYPNMWKISAKYGKDIPQDTNITITTWQSAMSITKNMDQRWMDRNFDVYIQDEVHICGSGKELQNIANSATTIEYRTGWTGSLKNGSVNALLVEGCFGPTKEITTLVNLMDQGSIAKLKINLTFLTYPEDIKEQVMGLDYPSEIKYIENSSKRTNMIAKMTSVFKGNSVILINHIAHGQKIYDKLRSVYPDKPVYFVHGSHYERCGKLYKGIEDLKPIIEKEDNAIIVANLAVFSTGISLKSLKYIVFGVPFKSYIKTIQSIGRGLRVREDKDKCRLIDLIDDFSIKKKKNTKGGDSYKRSFAYKHFIQRYEYYNQAGLESDFHRINL